MTLATPAVVRCARDRWRARRRVFGAVALAWLAACGESQPPPKQPVQPAPAPPRAPEVSCSTVAEPFVGTLCAPNDGERHPALLLFGDARRGDPMAPYARRFAALGRVSASVRYFGVPGTPSALVRVPVETAESALRAVLTRDDVTPSDIAVLGVSKGGEYALLVAATYPEITSVVAISPTPFAWFGLDETGEPLGCSWTKGGRTLPCVPQDERAATLVRASSSGRTPVSLRPLYEASRKAAGLVQAALFPLEDIQGPVLCLAGDDDRVWNSRAHCELALKQLKTRGHAHPDRAEAYAGAGHLFWVAREGQSASINVLELPPFPTNLGGSPEADARAAQQAWSEIERFLAVR